MNAIEKQKINAYKSAIEEEINKSNWLFDGERTYYELYPPKEINTNLFSLKIPKISLKDHVGFIDGNLRYSMEGNECILQAYSFRFEHSNTYVSLIEDKKNDQPPKAFGFHYDFDVNVTKNDHPTHHHSLTNSNAPRFASPEQTNEKIAFRLFLELLNVTFYENLESNKDKKPKLKSRHQYVSYL